MYFGSPDEIHSNQGHNFKAEVFQEMCSLLGLRKTRTTLLHPQSDGLVERFNCTLTTQLAILTSETSVTDRHFSLVLWVWAYQTAVQEYTGCMAAALMFGQEPQTPVELVSAPYLNQRSPGGPGFEHLQKLQNTPHNARESPGLTGSCNSQTEVCIWYPQ